jgi:HK97 family phage prohead protease
MRQKSIGRDARLQPPRVAIRVRAREGMLMRKFPRPLVGFPPTVEVIPVRCRSLARARQRRKRRREDEGTRPVTIEVNLNQAVSAFKTRDGLSELLDRMGDVLDPGGWELRNFLRNPIALFNHNKDAIVGRWHNLRVENDELRGHLEVAPKGLSARTDELRGLVEAGILKAVSVGFRPSQARPRGKDLDGVVFEKMELLETSLVSVPANPNALAVVKALGISDDTRRLVLSEPATTTKRAIPAIKQPERPSVAVEARVARLETERKQLMRRLLHQVEQLVAARELVVALGTIPGGAAELPAALKSNAGARGHGCGRQHNVRRRREQVVQLLARSRKAQSRAGRRERVAQMTAYLTDRITEKVDALEAKEVSRILREFAEASDDPKVRQLAQEFLECEVGFQDVIDGRISYVS